MPFCKLLKPIAFFIAIEAVPIAILIEPKLLTWYPGFFVPYVLAFIAFVFRSAFVWRSWIIGGAIVGYFLSGVFGPLHGPDVQGTVGWVIFGTIVGMVGEASMNVLRPNAAEQFTERQSPK